MAGTASAESVLWENIKSIGTFPENNPNDVILTSPQEVTTCIISPDGGSGWDNCSAYVLVNNTFNNFPAGQIHLVPQWLGTNTKDSVMSFTKAYSINTVDETIRLNETDNLSVSRTYATMSSFQSVLPDLSKNESMMVKIDFKKQRWTKASYNMQGSFNGRDTLLDPDVSACGTLDTDGATYTLTQNITTTGTCFIIGANNITLDGDGFTVNYSQSAVGYAINNTGYNFTTIKNVNILQNTTQLNSHAIYFKSASNGTIQNNTITTSGSNGIGIYMYDNSKYHILNNNTVTSNSTGIQISTYSYDNILNNNTVTSNDIGIYLYLLFKLVRQIWRI